MTQIVEDTSRSLAGGGDRHLEVLPVGLHIGAEVRGLVAGPDLDPVLVAELRRALLAITLPPFGGTTVWANTVRAYQTLHPALQALADRHRALVLATRGHRDLGQPRDPALRRRRLRRRPAAAAPGHRCRGHPGLGGRRRQHRPHGRRLALLADRRPGLIVGRGQA